MAYSYYLRPISDINVEHQVTSSSMPAYMHINEPISDEDSTALISSAGTGSSDSATSTFGMGAGVTFPNSDFSDIIVHFSALIYAAQSGSEGFAQITLNFNGTDLETVTHNWASADIQSQSNSAYKLYDLSFSSATVQTIKDYLSSNNNMLPEITLSIYTYVEDSASKSGGTSLRISQVYLEIIMDIESYSKLYKKRGIEQVGVLMAYKKVDGVWNLIATESECRSYMNQHLKRPANIPDGVTNLPILKRDLNWRADRDLSTVTGVTITNSYTVTGSESDSWVADFDGSGDIMCYLSGTSLTMASSKSGGMCLEPYSSSSIFTNMTALQTVSGMSLLRFYNGGNPFNMFEGCTSLTTTDFQNFNCTAMARVFYNCSNLTGSPVCGEKVTNMSGTYYNCSNLTGSPVCGEKVTDMSWTYYNCSNLTGVAVCGNNVTDMSWTYTNCTNLTGNAYIYSSNITNCVYCFNGKSNSKMLNIYVPAGSTTNTTFHKSSALASLVGVICNWTDTDTYFYNTAYNIYVYPVANVAAARAANGD